MELVIEPARQYRRQTLSTQVYVDRQHVSQTNRSFATIRFPEDTRSKDPYCIVLSAKPKQRTTKYEDCWSSFSDTYTDTVTSEFIEQIEKQAKEQPQTSKPSKQYPMPTVVNIKPVLPESSIVSQRASTKSTQPRIYRKGHLPISTVLSPTYAFCNKRYLEYSLSKNIEPSTQKHADIMSCKQLVHSTDIAICWHKYGKHTEPVLHINAY